MVTLPERSTEKERPITLSVIGLLCHLRQQHWLCAYFI
jgi:hypothetical protein